MRHWGTHGTVFRLKSCSLLQCLSCSPRHIACFHPETLLGWDIWSKSSLKSPNCTLDAVKYSIWAAALHSGCAWAVFTQHIINYRTGQLWATPVQEKVCKGHSISFSSGKARTFVSSLVSALQWCQLLVFYWRSTNQMNSSTPMWSGLKWGGSWPIYLPVC